MSDQELCMREVDTPYYGKMRCGAPATQFEADDDHWHDWLWCEEHAKGRESRCEPLKQAPRSRREESDE